MIRPQNIKRWFRAFAGSTPQEVVPQNDFYAFVARVREPRESNPISLDEGFETRLTHRLELNGISVSDYFIDVGRYREYVNRAGYHELYPNYYIGNFPEKSLEHYIAADLLDLNPKDTYIDIASEHSPVPEIYSRVFGVNAYRQDLAYAPGLRGDTIGSNAADMPVPNGFATKLALHCSFEHFEGDSDVRFLKEAARVLRPQGAACIVPLYMAERYSVMTDPRISVPAGVEFEPDARVHCVDGWGNRHGRFYDPEHLAARLVRGGLGNLSARVYRIRNSPDVDASCYARFALFLSNDMQ
jgi:SAM-dependent methyltransferase